MAYASKYKGKKGSKPELSKVGSRKAYRMSGKAGKPMKRSGRGK